MHALTERANLQDARNNEMKGYKSLLNTVLVIAALGTIPAFAQSTIQVTADIPFAFYAGNEKMPAGEYVVKGDTGSQVVILSTPRGTPSAFLFTDYSMVSDKNPGQAHLTFHRYGTRCYLAGVWSPVSASGRALRKSRGEREAEAALAPTEVATRIVPAH
jgi:hypothetical protein